MLNGKGYPKVALGGEYECKKTYKEGNPSRLEL